MLNSKNKNNDCHPSADRDEGWCHLDAIRIPQLPPKRTSSLSPSARYGYKEECHNSSVSDGKSLSQDNKASVSIRNVESSKDFQQNGT